MIHHEVDKGWATYSRGITASPEWRSTEAALRRLTGADLDWRVLPHRAHVAHLPNGQPVAVLRRIAAHGKWSVKIEGFQFWKFNRILRCERFDDVAGFDSIAEARSFTVGILRQAGASIRLR